TPAGFDMHRRPAYGPMLGRPAYNNLVTFDITKPENTRENIVGDLAERWEVSPDGKTWTFFLKGGVQWHDGKPFTADDVVYSLEKMVDSKRSSISSDFPAFESAEKLTENAVEVQLTQPSPSFLVKLASAYAVIQPKHLADVDWKSTDFMVGTGPFMLGSFKSGIEVNLVRNPDYFKKDEKGNQLPYLDGVKMTVMMDRSAEMDAYVTKKFDTTSTFAGIVNQEQLERVQSRAPEALSGDRYPAQGAILWLKKDYAPLSDIRVRQALALLVDQRKMRLAGYGGEDWGHYDFAYFYGGYGLYDGIGARQFHQEMSWDKPWDDRVAEAKQLMKDAGYEKGFKLELLTSTIPESQRMMALLGDMYERHLNIDVEIATAGYVDLRKKRNSGDFQIVVAEILTLMAEPDEVMGYFNSSSRTNFVGYSNKEVDRLGNEQAKTMDMHKRQLLTREIERLILHDRYAIPIGASHMKVGFHPHVKGFVIQDLSYSAYMSYERVWLAK
ncbi:ABC transporter substrate-binding protein, partial [Bacteroidota bacterium]